MGFTPNTIRHPSKNKPAAIPIEAIAKPKAVTNWMGNDAFLCKFSWRHIWRTPIGDALVIHGEVVNVSDRIADPCGDICGNVGVRRRLIFVDPDASLLFSLGYGLRPQPVYLVCDEILDGQDNTGHVDNRNADRG